MNKKIKFLFAMLLCIFVFGSCKTIQKEDPDFLGDFPPAELDKILAGTVKRTKNEIKPAEFAFVFYPRTNTVSIHHKFLGDNIWINLSEENRKVVIDSMKKYIEEYKTRTLSSKNNKKKAYFGKTNINVSWGLFGASYTAKPTLRCEYQLITNNRPYFILGNATVSNNEGANCPAMRMAFSPAQCADIIEILEQKNLIKIVEELKAKFEKYGLEETDVTSTIEKTAKESSDDDVVNYDSDF